MPAPGTQPAPTKRRSLPSVFADLAVIVGLIAFSFGFWLAWRPLGFIIGGLALFALGLLIGRSATRTAWRRL